ncbi:MAG: hypothetical protein ACREN3_10175, partial [Gemmatimonadaceae bacterium]
LRLRVLELRDSVFVPSVMAAATPGLRVLVDPQIPDPIGRTVTAVLEDTWRSYNAGRRYPVIAAVVQDTGRMRDGLPLATTGPVYAEVFPPDSATPACRVLVRVNVKMSGRAESGNVAYARKNATQALANESLGPTALGPCAMYATFGQPGSGIATWLAATAWRPGRIVDWSRRSPVWGDYYVRYRISRPLVDFSGRTTRAWQMRDELSDDGIACVGGDDTRCVSGVEAPAVAIPGEGAWQTSVVDIRASAYVSRYGSAGSLGPSTGWILSEMVRDLGRERFQRFWSSSGSLSDAFQRAAGTPLGGWLEQWARRTYGADVLGPSIPKRAWLSGTLLLIAGLIVAMVFASERRVA